MLEMLKAFLNRDWALMAQSANVDEKEVMDLLKMDSNSSKSPKNHQKITKKSPKSKKLKKKSQQSLNS
jgi:hypothetical protein